ncbi:unnamed protein product [Orchesella dallaii]|uniref:Alpha-1,6-mannosyl-glycoprotein 2-beta-N-acetylglucosaminyltransferase n=1 Tax=Orchesella dallaii TaxID=48710 RepID=A0ABP1R7T2_9HEXA
MELLLSMIIAKIFCTVNADLSLERYFCKLEKLDAQSCKHVAGIRGYSKLSENEETITSNLFGKILDDENLNSGDIREPEPLGTITLPETISPLNPVSIEEIGNKIRFLNAEQKIYNLEKYGPVNEKTCVIVIQVHSRVAYLNQLVTSLSRMRNVENSLIIFSHDLYLPELNEAIRKIDFARIMQIFYPHSIQLNPNRFPGPSPDDCPRDLNPTKAKEIKCRNADHPDIYGHYREAAFPQTKHHWWWKGNFVFRNLNVLQNYTGVIAFLEEDYYVTPDFLWVLKLMEDAMMRNLCHGCNLLSLGTYLSPKKLNYSQAVVTNWVSTEHNMAMTFNKTLWEKLTRCAQTFCEFDDYNWDWTLFQVSNTCLESKLEVLYPKAARVYHIGDCGLHHKMTKNCDSKKAAEAIDKGIKQYSSFLFPDNIRIDYLKGNKMFPKKGNGGWGDLRDRELCMSFVQ